jgi:hypothetical protein
MGRVNVFLNDESLDKSYEESQSCRQRRARPSLPKYWPGRLKLKKVRGEK